MKHALGKTVVIALGGSILSPDAIAVPFIKKFHRFLSRQFSRHRFVIVVGGGRLSRAYQQAAGEIIRVTDEDKDWLGIHATRLNAHLLRTVFRNVADPVVIDARKKIARLRYPVTIASGWRPGWSTDFVAMALAADFGADAVIVAGKPPYVYNKDYTRYKNAKPFSTLSWKEYKKLIPSRWIPGSHVPLDPVATRLGERKNIKAIVINGKDLKNFENLLDGKNFRGTVVG